MLETSLTKTLASKHQVQGVRHPQEVPGGRSLTARCFRSSIERPDKDPLVATFGGFPFERIPDGMGVVDFRLRDGMVTDQRQTVGGRSTAAGREMRAVRSGRMYRSRFTTSANWRTSTGRGDDRRQAWEKIMSARKRKTLVVCEDCHDDNPRWPLRWTRVMNDSLESRMR